MGRSISGSLAAVLALEGAETYSTLRIIFKSGAEARYSTFEVTNVDAGGLFLAGLISTGELQQSTNQTANRIRVEIQNIDKAAGILAAGETFAGSTAILGRLFRATGQSDFWEEMFRGEAIVVELTEETLELEIVSDLIAAGYSIASKSLAPRCQFVYKDPATCGYSGPVRTCSKSRKGPLGCQAHDSPADDFRFGGFEYPDIQPAEFSSGGGGGGGWGGGCFPAGTLVLMGNYDFKPIEEIRVGEAVISFNARGELNVNPVVTVFQHLRHSSELIEIDYDLALTPEHKILAGPAGKQEFIAARELEPGTIVHRLTAINGEGPGVWFQWEIDHILRRKFAEPIDVYNLEIAEDHTYFANRFAVSNSKDPGEV